VRRALAWWFAPLLLLLLLTVACSSDSSSSTDATASETSSPTVTGTLRDIDVTLHDIAPPDVTIPDRFGVDSTQTHVLKQSSGPTVKEGDTVLADYVAYDATTKRLFDTTFGRTGTPHVFTLSTDKLLKGMVTGIVGTHVGATIAMAIPPEDAFGSAGQQSAGIGGDDTIFFVLRVDQILPEQATGAHQTMPPTVPRLQYDANRLPSRFKATGQEPATVNHLRVYDVIKGKGPIVKPGQTIYVQYVGQIYPDGKVFDSSWSRGPFGTTIGEGAVIKGWDQGLVGQRVGSRVVLVIPSDLGYGSTGSTDGTIKPDEPLIFAVDILAAIG
jgi:FKBP-type peptidyl-prolyl cis-trans isomerase